MDTDTKITVPEDAGRQMVEKYRQAPFTLFFRDGFLSIYPKPTDGRCSICRRHVSELPVFGHELLSIHHGRLQINYREADIWEYRNTWECRDCTQREGPLWEVVEEIRLGRRLKDEERRVLREEKERDLEAFFAVATNTASEKHLPSRIN